jgi:hypothetical protein
MLLSIKQQYEQNMDRINKADVYFQTKFKEDSQEGQIWAMQALNRLLKEQEQLYSQLIEKTVKSTQFCKLEGVERWVELDIENEVENLIERIAIIEADGWKVMGLEYRQKSKVLAVGFKKG